MNKGETDRLIDQLAQDAAPVNPLAAPGRRAALTLAAASVVALIAIVAEGDVEGMLARYAGREWLMVAETGAMVATAILAILAAFMLSVPGRSGRWLLAPLPSFMLWFGLSGMGCLFGSGATGDHTTDCLTFIISVSLVVGIPLLWILSRAHPIDPLPVALTGGLGAAALSAFLLQFFHPFELTAIDLGVHFGAVMIILAVAAVTRRTALAPA